MSWKPEVKTGNDDKWYGNALAFATEQEAKYSADELAARWLLVVDTRAVESEEPVNYRIDFENYTMIAVKNEANSAP